ncbi:beta-lactamase/transpeptidase-like protein [Ascobolus immersus RN42]|uniref:Beta-lactamase/transpeptidase-like protein n=1 Tax=Ascobolus immersus RN42 TaxID=1160509 RepID=A0A3N4IA45_ASCIM|nr:beta-lactamase/transpeptidase-like protein [Ascobolus immersus RN42]
MHSNNLNHSTNYCPFLFDGAEGRLDKVTDRIQELFRDARAAGGVSFAVFHDATTIKLDHIGYRNLSERQVANADTRYPINSMTKGMVAVLAGIADHEGKLDFDCPVRHYLERFKSSEAVVQDHATVLDFLAHRTGIAGNDIFWIGSQNTVYLDRKELLVSFSTLKKIGPFRTTFSYNNWGYEIVALVLESVYGKELSTLLEEKIFLPLGMSRSGTNWDNEGNEISAYAVLQDGSPKKIERPQLNKGILMEAAGGVKSSIHDLLIYYKAFTYAVNDQFSNNSDETTGSIFKNLRTIVGAQISFPGQPGLREQSYAGGWVRCQLPGPLGRVGLNPCYAEMPIIGNGSPSRLDLYHQGLMPGSLSVVHVLPETKVGIIVLQNSTAPNDTADLISQEILQTLYRHQNPVDFVAFAQDITKKSFAAMEKVQRQLDEKRGNRPPGKYRDYKGTYWNGVENFRIDILECDRALKMRFQGMDSEVYDLNHYDGDTFSWLASHDETVSRGRLLASEPSYFLIRFIREGKRVVSISWCWSEFLPAVEEVFKKGKESEKASSIQRLQQILRSGAKKAAHFFDCLHR